MATNEDKAFFKRLLTTFKLEAEEHLQAMSKLLQELEKPSQQPPSPLIETLFREAHSLKGAARSVNLLDIESICQALESVLAELKRKEATVLPSIFFKVLYDVIDYLKDLLVENSQGKSSRNSAKISDIIEQIEILRNNIIDPSILPALTPSSLEAITVSPQSAFEKLVSTSDLNTSDTVRISTTKLGALLIQAEELLAFKFSSAHLVSELRELHGETTQWKKEWTKVTRDARAIRRSAEKNNGSGSVKKMIDIDRLLHMIERDDLFVKTLSNRFMQIESMAEQERRALTSMVDNLLEDMKQALMLPFSSLLEIFPKMVRDISRENGKEVELIIEGSSIEIDRRILEQMKNPLIHLVRNAIDHGIEMPQDREFKNKSRTGHISINITPREGNKIELIVADDGAGINLDTVTASALRLDIRSSEVIHKLSKQEILNLVFESGMSTSQILTDISGRGLGLAIVREKVEKLGGTVFIEQPDTGGTRFCITLPASLATFRGLLVRVGNHQFVLPSRNVERVARIAKQSIKTVENRETIELNNQALSLVHLSDTLKLINGKTVQHHQMDYLSVVVLSHAGQHIAFVVDEIISDQDVLVKNLGPQLVRVRNISGATVLGAGRVAPILNVADLFKSAITLNVSVAPHVEAGTKALSRASLLVAEDSITSRILLKNILESAGYNVTTAVDGIDALTTLRTGEFDLLVSDVEMPRMDGFDLTAKIRSDKKFSELPVVLVTALGSREHKERGVDVGANAYIVKGSFDQSNLLDAVRRLL